MDPRSDGSVLQEALARSDDILYGIVVPVHTHCWPGVLYILGVSDFVRRDPDGKVVLDTRESPSHAPAGSAVWGKVVTAHTVENVGEHELRNITVELKHLT